jgi:hypothetical protein
MGSLTVAGTYTVPSSGVGLSAFFAQSSEAATSSADKGGVIQFGGNYTGTSPTQWAGIAGLKDNATDGNYAGHMTFYTRAQGAGPVERMRINSSGNVGIGTTTIGERLNLPHAGRIKWNHHGGAAGARSVAMGNGYQGASGQDNYWSLAMSNADDSTIDTPVITIANDADIQIHGANASAGCPFTLGNNSDNSEHLAFSQGGRTNAIDNYYNANSTSSTMRLRVSDGTTGGTSNWALRAYASGAVHTAGGLSQSQSDKRLKTDVTNITTPLSKISAINGVNFKWINNLDDIKPNSGEAGKTDVGVIAQEIEAVLPDAVSLAPFDCGTENKDGSIPEGAVMYKDQISESGEKYLTVQYTKIIPLLIEGIKELTAKVKALEDA